MKTIEQQLNITQFPFTINDCNEKTTYCENNDGTIHDNRPKPVELTME